MAILRVSMDEDFEKFIGYKIIGDNKDRLDNFLKQNYTLIRCDASYSYTIKRGTSFTWIKTSKGEYKPKKHAFKARGPIQAEMLSIYYALRDVCLLRGITEKALILNDSDRAIALAAGSINPQRPHIKDASKKIREALEKAPFDVMDFGWIKSKLIRRIDRLAKKELKRQENYVHQKVKQRYNKVLRTIEKSKILEYKVISDKEVKVKSSSSNKWYTVILDNIPSCNCNYWVKKWGNKDVAVVLSRALPCKHMCRAAEALNKDIIEIFRKQIFWGVNLEDLE